MNTPCDDFDLYFEQWYADVYRLCLVLTRHPKDAQQLVFDAALRLGAAKDPHIGEEAARDLFFESAVRLCEDYYLRRMRRMPRREALDASLPFPLTDELWALMRLPFKKRAALCLLHAGIAPQRAAKIADLRTAPVLCEAESQVLGAILLPPEAAQAISDRVYDRFSERSVAFENRLHGIRSSFDRIAPYLALAVIALFLFAVWFSMQMAATPA